MGRGVSSVKTTRPSAASVLPRERLFVALDARRRAPLLWVHGPPGCGKTSLVSSYLDARAANGLWYQVDAGDADPATLCLYLGAAADGDGRRLPLFTAEYRSEPRVFARHYFRRLFESMEPPFLLVFDNYQELGSDGAVHDMVRDAAAQLPADGCVVVLSRAPPPATFIRMRANRELEVLDWDDLRLRREESDAIVSAHLPAADDTRRGALYDRTDGWAAGLILALGAWVVLVKRSRTWLVGLTIGSLAYFGFYRDGCVCPIGSIQNVTVSFIDPGYAVSYSVIAFFLLPLIPALFFGRVFLFNRYR